LCKKYSYVMVDEYQDTNEIQNLIYENLANDQKSNLFFVGDIKQSIYRFRQANPEIFIGKKDSFAKYDGENYPSAIILGDNFRSSEKVINGINDIFEKIMSREVGGINYDDTEKLYAGTTGLPSASVQLHIVDCAESGENSDAQYIAILIKKMIDEKAQIRTKTGTADVKAGDFAILLRSANVDGTAYAQALENIGIPAFVG
ncbi:MAG: UvrD-helicase domain-containing protein, partial [Oscillospiraceae bacterium]